VTQARVTPTPNSMMTHPARIKRKILPLLSIILLLLTARVARAHSADMVFFRHTIVLSPDGVQLEWELSTGPLLSEVVWSQGDGDGDSAVTEPEALAWVEARLAGLTATVDGVPLDWQVERVTWPASARTFMAGEDSIQATLWAGWPIPVGDAHTLQFQTNEQTLELIPRTSLGYMTYVQSLHWFAVQGMEGVTFGVPEQGNGLLRLTLVTPLDGAFTDELALDIWDSGQPRVSGVAETLGLGQASEGASEQTQRQRGGLALLEGLVRKRELSPLFLLVAFPISVVLGALHALSPGHGKTVVAAYLVGLKGKVHHAVVLGSIVTITHTGSVMLLGVLTLVAARYIMPTNVFVMLELASGLLIVGLGIGLLSPRIRGWRAERRRVDQAQRRSVVSQQEPDGRTRLVLNQPIEEVGPAHTHTPSTRGYIPRGPLLGNPLSGINWRSLVTLGVSGGLVPCPDAIALLLIAVTIDRVPLGLGLIMAFSLGLAVILIGIGILIVQGKRLFERLRWFDRVATVMPVVSAVVVTVLGAGLTANVFVKYDFFALGRQRAEEPMAAPTFDIAQARVLYAAPEWDEGGLQLFVVALDNATAHQLTQEPVGVLDFALSPDGREVAYSTADRDGCESIKIVAIETGSVRAELACGNNICSTPVWTPDGGRLLYARLDPALAATSTEFPTIWSFDPETGETAPLFQDGQMPGYSTQVSPDGAWLSYTSVNPWEVRLYSLVDGARHSLPTQTGDPAIWHPRSDCVLLTDYLRDYEADNQAPVRHLFRYDVRTGNLRDLTVNPTFDEALPAWSPDGEWIAAVRSEPGPSNPMLVRQIVLMRADGSQARLVTDRTGVEYSRPVWSPDGGYLLYHVRPADSLEDSIVRVLDVRTGEVRDLVQQGYLPIWLPTLESPRPGP
jgi:ABC-type nickel/cobalt efflux system permease component RcnA/Tol biopolymer transport system component